MLPHLVMREREKFFFKKKESGGLYIQTEPRTTYKFSTGHAWASGREGALSAGKQTLAQSNEADDTVPTIIGKRLRLISRWWGMEEAGGCVGGRRVLLIDGLPRCCYLLPDWLAVDWQVIGDTRERCSATAACPQPAALGKQSSNFVYSKPSLFCVVLPLPGVDEALNTGLHTTTTTTRTTPRAPQFERGWRAHCRAAPPSCACGAVVAADGGGWMDGWMDMCACRAVPRVCPARGRLAVPRTSPRRRRRRHEGRRPLVMDGLLDGPVTCCDMLGSRCCYSRPTLTCCRLTLAVAGRCSAADSESVDGWKGIGVGGMCVG